ncbi:MAG: DNA repair protein RecN [Anaerolineales bacterium]|nr:DNA repair protein RecN [Anaerolineales bacterium]HRX02526.1 DNA repair protein RecN [Anaerolineae bacterium]
MLSELHVSNFAIIDDLRLTFDPGFNVLTGETGAGKSIIIDAVDMLLGGKAGQEVIRADEDLTQIEGVFVLEPHLAASLTPLLEQEGLDGDDPAQLILSRELRRGGRTVARVNGRAVALSVLNEIGDRLVDIHGQTDHLSLMRPREHVNLLDRYAGLLAQRERLTGEVRHLSTVRKELASLRRDQRELARRIDLLTFQVDEISAAALEPGEDEALEGERRRLSNAEQLTRLAENARSYLDQGSDEQAGAMDLLSDVAGKLARLVAIDPDASDMLDVAEALNDQLSDLARSLEAYVEGIEFNPERLAEVEERLNLIFNLRRKYGDTLPDIISFGERALAELDRLTNAEVRTGELETEEARLLETIGAQGAALSIARRAAAIRMAAEVERELADLRMERARFDVDFRWKEVDDGAVVVASDAPDGVAAGRYSFDTSGLDQVEFFVSANPGEPLKPLVKVASGGETSRLMLALKTVLGRADETPTLIFDEIDVGIGGRVGSVVGRKLWELTARRQSHGAGHQVLCITHLPQLAGYGDSHFVVRKLVIDQRTRTDVVDLRDENRVEELAAMLGSNSNAGRESVEEMLAEVDSAKQAYLRS